MPEHTHHREESEDEVETVAEAADDIAHILRKHRAVIKIIVYLAPILGPALLGTGVVHLFRTLDVNRKLSIVVANTKDLCRAARKDHPGEKFCEHRKDDEDTDDGEEASAAILPSGTAIAVTPTISPTTPVVAVGTAR